MESESQKALRYPTKRQKITKNLPHGALPGALLAKLLTAACGPLVSKMKDEVAGEVHCKQD